MLEYNEQRKNTDGDCYDAGTAQRRERVSV